MEPTDFIQVEHSLFGPDGNEITHWRNALFAGKDKYGNYCIQYSDGSKECISKDCKKIRKIKQP